MPTFRARGVVFDNDGVLVDSHPQVVAAWTEIADEYGLPTEQLLVELVGVRSLDTLARYLEGDALMAANRRLEELEIDFADQTIALAGALDLVAALPDGRWTIATSGTAPLARARWDGAGIPVPDRVVTAEDVTNGKPDPEPFLRAAELLALDPNEVIIFEDSPAGGEAALASGATVIAVGAQPWPNEPHARVRDLTEIQVVPFDDASFDIVVNG